MDGSSSTLSATDDFDSETYMAGSGWSASSWTDSQDSNPSSGKIRVTNNDKPGQLEFRGRGSNANLYQFSRTFDFSSATGDATISFRASESGLDAGEELTITISDDQGTPTKTIIIDSTATDGSDASLSSLTTDNIPLNLLTSGATTISFEHDADAGGERVYIDDLSITAPVVTETPATLAGWIDFNQDGGLTPMKQSVKL